MKDITLDQLVVELKKLAGGDPEEDHMAADRLLVEFIGDRQVEKAYDAIKKWYA